MSNAQKAMIAGVVLLLLYVFLDDAGASMSTAPPAAAPAPPGASSGAAPPASHHKTTPRIDVAGAVPDGAEFLLLRNGNDAGGQGGWMQAFYDQVWLPASRVQLSSLTQEDWIYAMQFLQNSGGEFTRRDDVGAMGRAIIEGNDQRAGAEVFTQIISAVASIVPVVGPLISKVNAIQTGDLQQADAWATAMGGGAFGALMRSSLQQDTAQTRHLLANYNDVNSGPGATLGPWFTGGQNYDPRVLVAPDGPEAPLDRRVMTLPEEIGLMPMQSFSPQIVGFTATDAAGQKVGFMVRQRLFTRYAGGWILPWLCWHTVGDKVQAAVGTRQSINMVARLYRACDALIAGSQPWERENAPQGYFCEWTKERQLAGVVIMDPNRPPPRYATSGVYFYKNPFMGAVLGSIFPPAIGDSRYVGADGREYSYYGEPRTKLPPGAVGPKDDSAVDPARVAAAIAQAQVAVLTPAPQPPLANAVFVPPPPPSSYQNIALGGRIDLRWGGLTGGSSM